MYVWIRYIRISNVIEITHMQIQNLMINSRSVHEKIPRPCEPLREEGIGHYSAHKSTKVHVTKKFPLQLMLSYTYLHLLPLSPQRP